MMETSTQKPQENLSAHPGKLISKNPATGEVLAELETTSPESLSEVFSRAKEAQKSWAQVPLKKRAKFLINYREVLLDRVDELVELISKENGKPHFEAMINDLLPSVEILTYFGKKAPKILGNQSITLGNPIIRAHRKSYIHHCPLGVVAVISPWNFPFLLPFGEIMMALVAGNAVIFKPSEITPLIGLKIQEMAEQAGFPKNLLQTLIGDGVLGAALVKQRPDKIFFTGSTATGKKILDVATKDFIPVNLEMGGKDAMIVLPDADLDYATSAALWGAFGNSGQVCASTERLIVHEKIAEPFLNQLKEKVETLKPGLDDELGTITFEGQKKIYEEQLQDAKERGLEFLTGGEFADSKTRLKPTIVTGEKIEESKIYQEETFGPVIAATKFKSVSEAIEKANASRYGLLASVITQNAALGEEIAKKIEAGTITVNEVTYTAGLPETPWVGIKDSGRGVKHSEIGLKEFTQIRHIHKPRFASLFFKSWWWFPYTDFQYQTFRKMLELYRKSWIRKVKAVPDFLWNFVQFFKTEKRL